MACLDQATNNVDRIIKQGTCNKIVVFDIYNKEGGPILKEIWDRYGIDSIRGRGSTCLACWLLGSCQILGKWSSSLDGPI